MSEISQVLQRAEAVLVVKKIRDYDEQTTLRVFGYKLPDGGVIVCAAARFQTCKKLPCGLKPVPSSATEKRVDQLSGKGLQCDRVQPNKPDIGESSSKFPSELKL